ncbi:hypothetical protein L2E82_21145 [Cichorium intybus]|uniref:Uncharacterized protein n=1 Tax=Cichorium intybus TaxID=13427 RepID=A0ACB9DW90_CICIN|nr:hypothetical protein L2E82_21145 [Cichorium intybus]
MDRSGFSTLMRVMASNQQLVSDLVRSWIHISVFMRDVIYWQVFLSKEQKVVVGLEDLAANHDVMQIVEVLED